MAAAIAESLAGAADSGPVAAAVCSEPKLGAAQTVRDTAQTHSHSEPTIFIRDTVTNHASMILRGVKCRDCM